LINKLNTHLNFYFLIGGMPAAVASWIKNKDIRKVETILDDIIKDYQDDLSKHASEYLMKLTLIWNSIPVQLARENKKFVFSHVKAGTRSKDLEDALEWLVNAGLVHKVKKVDPPKVPLAMFADNTHFKIYLADIGIFRRMAKIASDFMFSKDKEYDLFRGAVTENYILNELISSTGDTPYFWRSGDAEIDFVAQIEGAAIPVEAKAGSNRSKSFPEFIKKYEPRIAVTVSARKEKNGAVTYIPLYAVWKIRDRVLKMKGRSEPGDQRS
jgi:predicted AAA+ superfamily ATPase